MFRKLSEALPSSLREHSRNLIGPDREIVLRGIEIYQNLLYGCAALALGGVLWAGKDVEVQGWEFLFIGLFGLVFVAGILTLIYVTRETRARRTSQSQARQALIQNSVLRELPVVGAITLIMQFVMPSGDFIAKFAGGSVGCVAYCAGAQLCYLMILLSGTPRPRRRFRQQTLRRTQKVAATVRVRC